MKYMADDHLDGCGRFWCVFEERTGPGSTPGWPLRDGMAGRMVKAFHGEGAERKARDLAVELNKEAA